jgi:hypothetical protein
MDFSKLLLQSIFDNVPDWNNKKDTQNCYQPCLTYKPPPCKSQPKYLPQQFPPYYDDADPNSITKYREWPKCIETFKHTDTSSSSNRSTLAILFALFIVYLVYIGSTRK